MTHSGLPQFASVLFRGRTLVLAYHNVVQTQDGVVGDASLHLSFDAFRRQLDLLQTEGEVIPLTAALAATPEGTSRRFVITFDDAYRGAVELAVPELRARGLAATVFVAPGLLGQQGFWWDAVDIDGWSDPMPLGQLRGEGDRIIKWASARGLLIREVPSVQRVSSFEELARALPDDLITLGCHTWDHPNLSVLERSEVREQLRRTLRWLETSGLPWIPWVAYPYGLTTPQVSEVARELGVEGGLRVDGGWVPRRFLDSLSIPRFNVPSGLSPEGFRMALSGLRQLLGRM